MSDSHMPGNRPRDDYDTPECLVLSEPARDVYSSDEDREEPKKSKKTPLDKFISSKTINASDILPWEMEYYLLAEYGLVEPNQALSQKPSIAELVEESLNFLFPNGIPESKKSERNGTWKSIVPQVIENFFQKPKNKWFKEMYKTDYTQDPNIFYDNDNEAENVRLRLKWSENRQNDDKRCAAQLISVMHNGLSYILKDELPSTYSPQRGETEKCNKVKWMMNEIMQFLHIPVVYTGDCNLDFEYKFEVPGRKLHGLEYRIKPDLTLYTATWPQLSLLPYCCIQVYGPYASKLMERRSSVSDMSSSKKNSIDVRLKEMQLSASDISSSEKQLKEMQLSDPEYNNTKSAVIERKNIPSDMVLIECSLSSGFNALNVHLDTAYHTKVNKRIMANIPLKFFGKSSDDEVLRKISAQLGIEMFGLLVQRAKLGNLLESFIKLFKEKPVSCLGMFVMNDRVYLSQISHSSVELAKIMKEDPFLNKRKIGPKFRYADWFFNLKNPNDRLALLVFLSYYHEMMENENPLIK